MRNDLVSQFKEGPQRCKHWGKLYVALYQQYSMYAEFQDRYDHTGRTRAAIRCFIKYLVSYEQGQQNKENPEPTTSEPSIVDKRSAFHPNLFLFRQCLRFESAIC